MTPCEINALFDCSHYTDEELYGYLLEDTNEVSYATDDLPF